MPVIAPCCTPFCSPMSSGSSSASSASSSITLVQLSAEDIAAEIVKVLGPEYEAYAKAVVAQGIDGERIATLIDVPQELVDLLKDELGVSETHVSDMRGLAIMAETGAPVFFDATHSVQQPGGIGTASGGQRQYVELLARCAIAAGVAGVFLEVHQDPDKAPSDGPCMLKLDSLETTLSTLKKFDELRKSM